MTSKDLTSEGIDTKTLTRMVTDGEIQHIARGLYAAADYIPGTYHSLTEACKLVDTGVVCLLSALSFHEIGTQNPPDVWIALLRGSRIPQVNNLPIQVSLFSTTSYNSGIEERIVDGTTIKVYSIPKTIADCFKYRNKIGLDVAIEALKDVIMNRRVALEELIYYAKICRVHKIMMPYLEALV